MGISCFRRIRLGWVFHAGSLGNLNHVNSDVGRHGSASMPVYAATPGSADPSGANNHNRGPSTLRQASPGDGQGGWRGNEGGMSGAHQSGGFGGAQGAQGASGAQSSSRGGGGGGGGGGAAGGGMHAGGGAPSASRPAVVAVGIPPLQLRSKELRFRERYTTADSSGVDHFCCVRCRWLRLRDRGWKAQ